MGAGSRVRGRQNVRSHLINVPAWGEAPDEPPLFRSQTNYRCATICTAVIFRCRRCHLLNERGNLSYETDQILTEEKDGRIAASR